MVENESKWKKGSITIFTDETNDFVFQPECFSFKFEEALVNQYQFHMCFRFIKDLSKESLDYLDINQTHVQGVH